MRQRPTSLPNCAELSPRTMMCRISSPAFACQLPVNRTGVWAVMIARPTKTTARISAPEIRQGRSMLRPYVSPQSYAPLARFCSRRADGQAIRDYCDLSLPLLHHPHERPAELRVELEPAALLEISQRFVERPRFAVRAPRPQCIVDIAHVHQLAGLMAVAGVMQYGVPAAVDQDVVLLRHDDGEIEVCFDVQQDAGAGHGVL